LKDDSSYWDDSLIQTADIDMGGCVWDRGIARGGSTFPEFAGVYDGGGHEISGLTVSSSLNASAQTGVGLFSRVSGTIRDIGFAGQVNGTATDTGYVGGLVGWLTSAGSIENSYVTGNVSSSYAQASGAAASGTGGLVGVARDSATISGSHATGNVTASTLAGGLAGRVTGSVIESYATGDVTATARIGDAGGLVGNLSNANVTRSFATGDVTGGTDAQHLGGLFGSMANSVVVDSFATGGVRGWTQSGSTYGQVGGVVGDASGGSNTITRVYSATISGMSPSSGDDTTIVGGVAGIVATTTWNSVAWNRQTAAPLVVNPIGSTATVSGVTGFTTSEMTDDSTYTSPTGLNWNSGGSLTIAPGYDPSYTWGMCATVNNGYPFLTGTYATNPCASAPSAPQSPVAISGNTSATVTWAAPLSDGASALTGYTVTASPGGQTCATVPPTTTCTVTGLTNGTTYTFDVTATNAVGTSAAATSNAVTPTAPTPPAPEPSIPPSEPLNVIGIAGDASAVISWDPPASAGSFAVTDYQAVVSPGGQSCTVKAPSLTCTITGLTNGTTYTVIVRALNGAGWGAWSDPSGAFTPVDPVTKTIVIAGARADLDGRRGVQAFGETTGLVGATVQARVHLSGEINYYSGSRRQVGDDGTFTWQRKTNKKVYVYFRVVDDPAIRSNRLIIPLG